VAEYCDEHVSVCACVCVSVCMSVREHISGTTPAIFTNFSVHVAYGRGPVARSSSGRVTKSQGEGAIFLAKYTRKNVQLTKRTV